MSSEHGEIYANVDYAQLQRQLDQAKSEVFKRPDSAFFGPLMCSLDFSWNEEVKTAATDGKHFWWAISDFQRCLSEGKGEAVSTIMHELWHVARLHGLRRGSRCPDVWNHACDIRINRDLRKSGYYVGSDWLDRPDLDHVESEEDIYDLLPKNPGGGSVNGNQQGQGAGHGKCQHGHGGMGSQTDPHATVGGVVKAIQSAKMSGQPGAIPGHIEQTVNEFLAPIIPWEQHLYKWMSDLADPKSTWRRPRRRNLAQGMYLPTRHKDEGRLTHLVYFQDVSGSITNQEIVRFNSELKYVWDQFKPKKMTICLFDTRITKVIEFNHGDSFDKIEILGRGGTCLVCVHEKIVELKPTAAIVFSDMQVAPMKKLPFDIPVLWVASNAPGATVPFGQIIHIKV